MALSGYTTTHEFWATRFTQMDPGGDLRFHLTIDQIMAGFLELARSEPSGSTTTGPSRLRTPKAFAAVPGPWQAEDENRQMAGDRVPPYPCSLLLLGRNSPPTPSLRLATSNSEWCRSKSRLQFRSGTYSTGPLAPTSLFERKNREIAKITHLKAKSESRG